MFQKFSDGLKNIFLHKPKLSLQNFQLFSKSQNLVFLENFFLKKCFTVFLKLSKFSEPMFLQQFHYFFPSNVKTYVAMFAKHQKVPRLKVRLHLFYTLKFKIKTIKFSRLRTLNQITVRSFLYLQISDTITFSTQRPRPSESNVSSQSNQFSLHKLMKFSSQSDQILFTK